MPHGHCLYYIYKAHQTNTKFKKTKRTKQSSNYDVLGFFNFNSTIHGLLYNSTIFKLSLKLFLLKFICQQKKKKKKKQKLYVIVRIELGLKVTIFLEQKIKKKENEYFRLNLLDLQLPGTSKIEPLNQCKLNGVNQCSF